MRPMSVYEHLKKPIYVTLREKRHLNVGFIEDLHLQGGMIRKCQSNATDTCCLFTRLGFVIHSVKSALVPAETISASGICSDICQYNYVPSPTENVSGIKGQCLGLISSMSISVAFYSFTDKLLFKSYFYHRAFKEERSLEQCIVPALLRRF